MNHINITQLVWLILLSLLVSTTACNNHLFMQESSIENDIYSDNKQIVKNESSSITSASSGAPASPADSSLKHEQKSPASDIPAFTKPEETNIWYRIKNGFQLNDYKDHKRVAAEIKRYSEHQYYIDTVIERADPFLYLIMEQIDAREMPAEIVLLPVVESAYQAFAYSHGRAAGIWQFIPSTGRMFGLKQDWWYDGRRDILASTHAATKYLESLHKRLGNDWLLALAAYNAGEGNVRRAIRKNKKKGLPTDFWHLDLPNETKDYVPRLLAISAIISNPEEYNITLTPVLNEPRVAEVKTSRQIDLALVAKLADISIEDVYRLNPGFNHWATSPDREHTLLIPVEKETQFLERLAAIPEKQFVQWKRHKIKSGETLSHIAHRYHTTVKLLTKVNRIGTHQIRQGRYLLIPVATQSLSNYTLTSKQRAQSRLSQKRKGQKQIIHVKDGDTFWEIASQYKLQVRTLAKWNGMAPGDPLKPGQQLVLWTRQTSPAQSIGNRLPASTIRTIHYTVRRGDSLALISNKFNVTVKQVRQWNKLPKNRFLQPGQKLKLYVDVTQQT